MNNLAENLLAYFAARGCATPDIDLLQPADPLLDTAGEDLRRRIFITNDRNGANLCLRPEFTIPVCLYHLQNNAAPCRHAYAGTVFRQRMDEPPEFLQAGIEDIGNEDRMAADIAAIADCAGAVRHAGIDNFRLVLGDQALFEAALASLDLPVSWQRRLGRAFGDLALLRADVARLSNGNGDALKFLPAEIRDAVKQGDRNTVESWIAARMEQSGLPVTGARTPAEIALRVLEKAELAATRLDEQHRAALDAFLAIECPIGSAPEKLQQIAVRHDLAIDDTLEIFTRRVAALKLAGLREETIFYRASFGRRLDYYTGLVFEIVVDEISKPLAGGGRYDRLMSLLGAKQPIPAVGFSIWLDRLAQARGAAQ
jgi:ATP phosphoribosyltransferase regulatory subunit